MRRRCHAYLTGVGLLMVLTAPSLAFAQSPLALGKTETGKVSDQEPVVYTFAAKTAGLISVAVQGTGGDLALVIADEDGQPLPDGNVDRDLNGNSATEQASVTITEPGSYQVRVRMQGSGASDFQIGAAWLPFPPFQRANPDPDRRASMAKAVQVGRAHEDSLDGSTGDAWDWFVFKVTSAGTLAVITRPLADTKADLVLEVFTAGNFSQPAGRSDQDLQGNSANETVSVEVTAGQAVHVKVSSVFSGAGGKYRLSSNIIK